MLDVILDDEPREGTAYANHVLKRTIVLPDVRVLFLPMPKAGCTSVLWLLAEMAGLDLELFERSPALEAAPSLTVHDTNLWPDENRLLPMAPAEREAILGAEDWLRFTIVRDPAPRLWSAWQSKLLLREPRFVEEYGEQPWFPRAPERPQDVIEDFRTFVAAVGAGEAQDVHWVLQSHLVDALPFTHVGRVERMDATMALLREHVGEEQWPRDLGRENRSPLPRPPHAYDEPSARAVAEVYARDYERFGYTPPVPTADGAEDWERAVTAALPALQTAIEDRRRVGQLHGVAVRRMERLESTRERLDAADAKVEELSRKSMGTTRAPVIRSLEGDPDFAARWAWAEEELAPGFTAVVRVKNEERTLPWTLPPLLRAVPRVVIVDNGSTDRTKEVALEAAAAQGAEARLWIVDYPHAIARCGAEHLSTPPHSVHSLVHFYNWSFSHVRTRYALKWDADMVLTDAAVRALRDLEWQLEQADVIVKVPRSPLYVADDRRGYVDIELRNTEPWGWPNKPGYSFVKAMDWELNMWADRIPSLVLPEWSCVELKHLDADEFGHWSDTDFMNVRQSRKRREWEVFRALQGGGEPPEGVELVAAPEGVHVVDFVRDTWLRERAIRDPFVTGA